MKNIAVLGSTGSIGTQTLDVVKNNSDKLKIVALAAHTNDVLLKKQIEEFKPLVCALSDEKAAERLRKSYRGKTKIFSGEEGLKIVATLSEVDTVLASMVGYAGLRPTMEAIKSKKNIALANKETLVAAGSLVMNAIKEQGVKLTPVDSEHCAIFQALQGNKHIEVKKLLITASGGPFRGKTKAELENVTLEDCLKHPNWAMGKKITVDSATLANKGLEVIEAHWLFGIGYDAIKPIVHPQSIVHSMVEYSDGSIIAQMGLPDMKLPIQYALSYPDRWDTSFGELDLVKVRNLTFEEPDYNAFPALSLAISCGKKGGTLPCIFNAANEEAVYAFLAGKIRYVQIVDIIRRALDKITNITNPSLEDIEETDRITRLFVKEYLEKA